MSTHLNRPIRSWLFTPGTRIERFAKATEVGADVLILDLEDAVSPGDKASARDTSIDWLKQQMPTPKPSLAMRINGLDTAAGIADINALLAQGVAPDYLVLPKVESEGHVLILDRLLASAGRSTRIIGLIESVRGIRRIEQIAGSSSRLAGLMLGAADMAADLGCSTSWEPLAAVRSRLVEACAHAAIAAIDSPFFDLNDMRGHQAEVTRAVEYGFAAKAAIHPDQIAPINNALTPTADQIAEAQAILRANDKGVAAINGQMIDEAVARKARRLLAAIGG